MIFVNDGSCNIIAYRNIMVDKLYLKFKLNNKCIHRHRQEKCRL